MIYLMNLIWNGDLLDELNMDKFNLKYIVKKITLNLKKLFELIISSTKAYSQSKFIYQAF